MRTLERPFERGQQIALSQRFLEQQQRTPDEIEIEIVSVAGVAIFAA